MKRILFDQNVPRNLARHLDPHHVEISFDTGWSTLNNGGLIAAAEAEGFEVLVTADQNIAYQQNLAGRRIAIVVLDSNRWSSLADSVLKIWRAIENAAPGSFQFVQVFSRKG